MREWGKFTSALVAAYFMVRFLEYWWEVFAVVARAMVNSFLSSELPG
jgi:hypothetical protein